MKNALIIILVIALVILFGTWPLSILGKVVEWIGIALNWLASALDIFCWNGLI